MWLPTEEVQFVIAIQLFLLTIAGVSGQMQDRIGLKFDRDQLRRSFF